MTNVFTAVVADHFTANTDTLAIEITALANTTVKIKKIRIMHSNGDETVTSDYHRKVKLVTESVAGTGGASYTPIDLDDNNNPSVSTVKIGPMTPGTISQTIDVLSIHSVTDFYWSAADDDDKIVIAPGGIFGIVVNPAN